MSKPYGKEKKSEGRQTCRGRKVVNQAGRSRCLTFPPRAASWERCSAARMCPWTTFSTKVKSTKFFPFLRVHRDQFICAGMNCWELLQHNAACLGSAHPQHTWMYVTGKEVERARTPGAIRLVEYLRAKQSFSHSDGVPCSHHPSTVSTGAVCSGFNLGNNYFPGYTGPMHGSW